ncbi:uncharacterized protein LOC135842170 [Planococcus citri]|uniref:uncharacterized protein LOC135842170 n=1 Tax=Planococcus citri TaxID=170843 RepID=UPI0031F9514D
MDLDKHLIREVKNRPVLYDSSHSNYKDIDYKQQTWIEIGRKLIGTEDDTTSVNALKVRWKSLRDAYVKERKYDISKSCGLKVKLKKPWRFKKQMEFLAPFIQSRKEIIDVSNTEENDSRSDITIETKIDGPNSSHNDSQKTDNEPDSSVNHKSDLADYKLIPRERKATEIDSFFRGISDAVMGLNKKNQIIVQREIATLVMNFKLKELEEEEKRSNNS